MKMPKDNFVMCYRDDKTDKVMFHYKGDAVELLALTYCLLHKIYSEVKDADNKEYLQKMNKELTEYIFDTL